MAHRHLNPQGLLTLDGFSQVVITTGKRTAYIAGQTAYDEQQNLKGEGDYFVQIVEALRNLRTAVEAAGGTSADVVSSTVFLRNLDLKVSEIFFQALSVALDGAPFPAHAFSLIGVQDLASPEVLVEITAIAVFD